MINKIRFHYLRMGEFIEFLYDVLIICQQKTTEAMKLAASIAALQTDTETFDQNFKLDPGSPVTQELIDLDDRRDDCIIGIRYLLEAYVRYFTQAMKSAARSLLDSMDKYGTSIARLNFPTETSTINSLLEEWETKPVLSGAVTTLTLSAWITELKTVNASFKQKYVTRSTDKGSEGNLKTLEVRKAALNAYRNLIQRIEAGATLADDNSYAELIASLNVHIDKYNLIADSHKKEKEDEEEQPK